MDMLQTEGESHWEGLQCPVWHCWLEFQWQQGTRGQVKHQAWRHPGMGSREMGALQLTSTLSFLLLEGSLVSQGNKGSKGLVGCVRREAEKMLTRRCL